MQHLIHYLEQRFLKVQTVIAAVDFSAGTKDVFCTYPAKRAPSPSMDATAYVTTHNSTLSDDQTIDSGVLAGPVTITGTQTITGNLVII
jgi:hypothetical protein